LRKLNEQCQQAQSAIAKNLELLSEYNQNKNFTEDVDPNPSNKDRIKAKQAEIKAHRA
jgi:hypothetical protein